MKIDIKKLYLPLSVEEIRIIHGKKFQPKRSRAEVE